MKVIMFGPSYGHNAAGFIELFKSSTDHEYVYICKGKTDWHSVGNLKVISYEKSFTKEIVKALKEKAFIWVHGGYDIKQMLSILFHKNNDSFMSVNLWGEQVAMMSVGNSIKGVIYRYIFKKIDLLHCNWYGVYDLVKNDFTNAKVYPWGLVSNFYSDSESDISDFTSNFMSDLPANKFKFFYPKSILPISGQVEVIEACKILKEDIGDKFVVYLWNGNTSDARMVSECTKLIKKYQLSDTVRIVKHPYLSFYEIKQIWNEMDCGLQIAKSDQLSTSFLEPQYLEKEIIATSIAPYVAYNHKYNTNLKMVGVDVIEIAKAMKSMANNEFTTPEADLRLRKKIVLDEFNFDENIKRVINEYIS